jgi:hypothetical protein
MTGKLICRNCGFRCDTDDQYQQCLKYVAVKLHQLSDIKKQVNTTLNTTSKVVLNLYSVTPKFLAEGSGWEISRSGLGQVVLAVTRDEVP